jgi:pimeloyl-ACP methyl ester carboxylesterase
MASACVDVASRTLMARNGDAEIWTDQHGDHGSGVVLLMGAGSQAIQWEPAFYEPIVAAGHRVVRFDWRDVGLSCWGDYGVRPYGPLELIGDVIAVLDRFGLDRAHLIGFSMGGGVALSVAALYPARVVSLTTLSAPCLGAELPRSDAQMAALARLRVPQPDSDDELVDWFMDRHRMLASSSLPFDDDEWRIRIQGWVDRGHNRRCPHLRVWRREHEYDSPLVDPEFCTALLRRIAVPTLSLHGDEDLLILPQHGEALAAKIPGARARRLPGRGHDLYLDPTGEVTGLVVDHIGRADAILGRG